uniref:E3 ubiquitin-protein ligase RBBP6 n=1 Tax=Panagrellus redivivus TaxID=6233 RepID=A0A7E4V5T4_PANRE
MSSTVHYKFRSVNDLKVINFDSASIAVSDLVQQICAVEKINMEMFDLKLSSANNNQYERDGIVPKNSMVIVQRVPAENAKKAPKTNNAEITTTSPKIPKAVPHIDVDEFSKMSESERLQHALLQSTYKYDPSNYSRKSATKKVVAKVPESFQCSRCYELGAHFTSYCPLLGTRTTSGIPNSELIETTEDDPDRMLHGNGKWYITKMLQRTREQKKQREQLRLGALGQTLAPTMETEVPDDLKCLICHDLYKDAIILRCGDSFCGDCIYETVKTAALNNRVCLCPQCQEPAHSIPSKSKPIDISSSSENETESESESCDSNFSEYDARDMEVIETAWSLVHTFEPEDAEAGLRHR